MLINTRVVQERKVEDGKVEGEIGSYREECAAVKPVEGDF